MDGGLKKRHMIGGSILNALIAESKRINILLSEAGFVGTAGQKWMRRKLMNWISVRDRLPEDQVEVLVATRSKNGVRNIDKGYLAIDHFIHRGRAEVTHWMPLPELPKEEK
jgi:hypothetical protein